MGRRTRRRLLLEKNRTNHKPRPKPIIKDLSEENFIEEKLIINHKITSNNSNRIVYSDNLNVYNILTDILLSIERIVFKMCTDTLSTNRREIFNTNIVRLQKSLIKSLNDVGGNVVKSDLFNEVKQSIDLICTLKIQTSVEAIDALTIIKTIINMIHNLKNQENFASDTI
tara:strand:+ start:477 stop:986 length:510 start_codon:yes stop_codon:yes gene_type:complete